MRIRPTLFLPALGACAFVSEEEYVDRLDVDGDGVQNDRDCAPDDPDRARGLVVYRDGDADGFGAGGETDRQCETPAAGWAVDNTDCNDDSADSHPGAPERCDDLDNDCDGVPDDDLAFSTWALDADGDGHASGQQVLACREPDGGVPVAVAERGPLDCDDADPEISPDAIEVWYDGVDQDCDGNDTDQDEDGFLAVAAGGTDCDDADPLVSPGRPEDWSDDVDQDCDGNARDEDGDGFERGDGPGADCDDRAATVNPAAAEDWSDDVDQDCDGNARDQDLDGFERGAGGDCDDRAADVSPGRDEIPYDGTDQDCDGRDEDDVDDDGVAAVQAGGRDCDDGDPDVRPGAIEVWYDGNDQDCDGNDADRDGDGHAPPDLAGTVGLPTDDCDDGDPEVHPGVDEDWSDEIDQDCDGNARDEDGDGVDRGSGPDADCDDQDPARSPGAPETWYDGLDQDCDGNDTDQDGDGFAAPEVGGPDCLDTDPAVSPAAEELVWYDGVDQDCDGNDTDQDGDGFAAVSAGGDDCDDGTAAASPSALELPGDGVDQDCTGFDVRTCFLDRDGDGFGSEKVEVDGPDCGALVAVADDCDDANPDAFPGAEERCDGIVQDCLDGAEVGLVTLFRPDGTALVLAPDASGVHAVPAGGGRVAVCGADKDGTDLVPTVALAVSLAAGDALSVEGFPIGSRVATGDLPVVRLLGSDPTSSLDVDGLTLLAGADAASVISLAGTGRVGVGGVDFELSGAADVITSANNATIDLQAVHATGSWSGAFVSSPGIVNVDDVVLDDADGGGFDVGGLRGQRLAAVRSRLRSPFVGAHGLEVSIASLAVQSVIADGPLVEATGGDLYLGQPVFGGVQAGAALVRAASATVLLSEPLVEDTVTAAEGGLLRLERGASATLFAPRVGDLVTARGGLVAADDSTALVLVPQIGPGVVEAQTGGLLDLRNGSYALMAGLGPPSGGTGSYGSYGLAGIPVRALEGGLAFVDATSSADVQSFADAENLLGGFGGDPTPGFYTGPWTCTAVGAWQYVTAYGTGWNFTPFYLCGYGPDYGLLESRAIGAIAYVAGELRIDGGSIRGNAGANLFEVRGGSLRLSGVDIGSNFVDPLVTSIGGEVVADFDQGAFGVAGDVVVEADVTSTISLTDANGFDGQGALVQDPLGVKLGVGLDPVVTGLSCAAGACVCSGASGPLARCPTF